MRWVVCQLCERYTWVIGTSVLVREVLLALILDPQIAYNKAVIVFVTSSKEAVK
jgi:hypothetical protein